MEKIEVRLLSKIIIRCYNNISFYNNQILCIEYNINSEYNTFN